MRVVQTCMEVFIVLAIMDTLEMEKIVQTLTNVIKTHATQTPPVQILMAPTLAPASQTIQETQLIVTHCVN